MSTKQRYKVVDKIDAGGMAEIFKGYAVSLDGIQKAVAIKRVRPHLATNRRFIKMFIDEARLSMRLSHANITQVFDVGRAQDTYFLVMELVDGANLRKLQQIASERGQKIPVAVAVHVIIEVCKGLAAAHEAVDDEGKRLNIVHRDVSPPNILLSKAGDVKITDFGLAKAASHLEATDPGVVKGKFSYLSPEACEGKDVDPRADVFSAGILLHELLSVRRLFMGQTDLQTVELVRKCEVAPPSATNPEVDRDLDAIVLKALERDRKRRFQSARDLGDALAKYLFAHNMKVTAFDVQQMMRGLLSAEEKGDEGVRIVDMIKEEVIHLSSLGRLPSVHPTDGAEPLELESFQGRKTAFEDIWADFADRGDKEPSSEVSGLRLEVTGERTVEAGSQKRRKGGRVWVAVAALLAAAAAAAVAAWYMGWIDLAF